MPVEGRSDGDFDDETANVLLTASGGGYDGVAGSTAVTVLDDDLLEIVSIGGAGMVEGASRSSITFRLSSQPPADTTVTLGWLDGKHPNPAMTIDIEALSPGHQQTVTFSRSNWNSALTAMITPINDSDSFNEIGVLYLRLPNGAEHHQTFVVLDDDIRMSVSPTSLIIDEGGTGSFAVRMTTPPGDLSRTRLSITSNNPDITFSQSRLHFNAGNWSVPQTVTFRAAEDADTANDTAIIGISDDYDLLDASVSVLVVDGEGATSRLVLTPNNLTLNEGASATFTVRLAAQPTNGRTVELSSTNSDVTVDTDTSATGSQTTLSFTVENWNNPRTVTLRAAQDDDKTDDRATINLRGGRIAAGAADVWVTDNDTVRLKLSAKKLTVDEGGAQTFTVRLNIQPSDAVAVTLTRTGSQDVTLDTDSVTPGNQNTLTFTTENWDRPQTVTVSAAHDDDGRHERAMINLTGAGETADTVKVSVIEDEEYELQFSFLHQPYEIDEALSDLLFYVELPLELQLSLDENLTVTVTSDNPDLRLYGESNDPPDTQYSLRFIPDRPRDFQGVFLVALHDDDSIDDMVNISVETSGGDYNFASVRLSVTILDDDLVEVLQLDSYERVFTKITDGYLWMAEGSSRNIQAKLARKPAENVTVTLRRNFSDSPLNFDTDPDSPGNQNTLTFTASNWSTPQTVTVSAAEDSNRFDDNDWLYFVLPSGATKVAAVYMYDNDVDLDLSTTSLTINEGGSGSFTVRMDSSILRARTVALTSSNEDVTISPAQLNFYSMGSNRWDVSQTVTLSAAEDSNMGDETATISLEIRMANYGHFVRTASKTVTVTVRKKEGVGFSISAISPAVDEKGAGIFAVRLGAQSPGRQLTALSSESRGAISGAESGDTAGLASTGSNQDGADQQFDRRRPEDPPYRFARERHVRHGFDHRRRL